MTEFYTPYYQWAAEWDELSLPEALLLSRIKYWAEGCWESYGTLAKVLKLSRRAVIEATTSLLEKELIVREYKSKKKRILKFNYQRTNLPIFDQQDGAPHAPPTAKMVRHMHQGGAPHAPNKIFNKQIDKIDETNRFLSESLTTQKAKPLSGQAFEDKRRRVKNDLFAAEEAAKK